MATTFAALFGAVFPSPNDTQASVVYGPTGAEFTGTVIGDSAATIVAALYTAAAITPLPSNVVQVAGQTAAATTAVDFDKNTSDETQAI